MLLGSLYSQFRPSFEFQLKQSVTGCGDNVQPTEVRAGLLEVHGARYWQVGQSSIILNYHQLSSIIFNYHQF